MICPVYDDLDWLKRIIFSLKAISRSLLKERFFQGFASLERRSISSKQTVYGFRVCSDMFVDRSGAFKRLHFKALPVMATFSDGEKFSLKTAFLYCSSFSGIRQKFFQNFSLSLALDSIDTC